MRGIEKHSLLGTGLQGFYMKVSHVTLMHKARWLPVSFRERPSRLTVAWVGIREAFPYFLNSFLALIFFPGSSVGKESACSAGDSGSILGLGKSPEEAIGYPLQYSWASLVAQLVKNPPVMWETWVRSLGCEDPLEKGKTTQSHILAWRIPWTG